MRLIDIIVSLFGLIILLVPILLAAFTIRLFFSKKIFFYQKRVGLNMNEFEIIKFSTMTQQNTNKISDYVTVDNDPRVSKIGKFFRDTKINELPQLFNILKGDMSLIGPRPLPIETFKMYDKSIQEIIVKKKPGLSGIGSVIFSEENKLLNRNDNLDFYFNVIQPYKGKLEKWFVENYSFQLCIKILIITFIKIFFKKTRVHWLFLKKAPIPPISLKKILRYDY
jgi:lipopolysaccharide/colanic/teichoic acid biosynthesis glycosyltransferase